MRLNVVAYFYFEVIMNLIEIFKQHCMAYNASCGYLYINGAELYTGVLNSAREANEYIKNIVKAAETSELILELAKQVESDLIDIGVTEDGGIRIGTKFFNIAATFSYGEQEFLRCFTTRYEARQKQRVKEANRLAILNILKEPK